jgi:trehalose 6-phosphate synthase
VPDLTRLLLALGSTSGGLMRWGSSLAAAVGAAVAAAASPHEALERPHREGDRQAGSVDPLLWTAVQLKETLRSRLQGQRVIVLANREPLIHEWNGDRIVVRHPASGLVTALEPVMRACSGVWVAHGSGSADRAASDVHGRVAVRTAEACYGLRRVWLTHEEERGYYYGFSNEALWPLCHLAPAQPVFRRQDWEQYQEINRRFADAVASEADSDEPIVLVQDYHFALVPRLLRDRFPNATILTFWHIPWPNAERFAICPHQAALLDGLLGSSIVGFQTPQHCHNFLESVDRCLEARIEREEMGVVHRARTTAVRAYPISVDWPNRWSAASPSIDDCHRVVREELGLPPNARLIVSVDRLDYTKGFEERQQTFERTLERWADARDPLAILQIAAPSRTLIPRYREFAERVRAQVEQINARRSASWPAVTFLHRHCEPSEIVRYYRAADVCYVSSLHDGMNLVAKEFVSSRDDEQGVLLLSRFAGAARELTEALVVNPYDIDGVADTLVSSLGMPIAEQRERMRAMRRQVAAHNVYRWAGQMLIDASQLREREQLHRRLKPGVGDDLRDEPGEATLS